MTSFLFWRRRGSPEPVPGTWVTGAGQVIRNVHPASSCAGEPCCVHNPSDHSMREFTTNWRNDRGMMERVCEHGVGHPDPDHLAHIARAYGKDSVRVEGVHGCDGCCEGAYDVSMFSPSDKDDVGVHCDSCRYDEPADECPNSMVKCGHHCNHSWSHDSCCWCLMAVDEDGVWPSGATIA